MKFQILFVAFLLMCTGWHPAVPEPVPALTSDLPGSSSTISAIRPYIKSVVVAVAQAEAMILRRHSSHISTTMDLGNGEFYEGGGTVTQAECRQLFTVTEVLVGPVSAGKKELYYGFVEESDAFPGPSLEIAIPTKIKVILFIGENDRILKAARDNAVNRNLLESELDHGDPSRIEAID